jgi:hypothetical protein
MVRPFGSGRPAEITGPRGYGKGSVTRSGLACVTPGTRRLVMVIGVKCSRIRGFDLN